MKGCEEIEVHIPKAQDAAPSRTLLLVLPPSSTVDGTQQKAPVCFLCLSRKCLRIASVVLEIYNACLML